MKTKLLLLLTFLSLNLFAQEFEECATPNTRQNIDYGLINQDRTSQQPPNTGPYCIDVFFHVIRDNNGNGGFSGNFDDVMSLLNLRFNAINIYVNNVGSDEITNSDFLDITFTNINNHEGLDLENASNNPNAINIYLVDSINGNQVAGFAFDIISTNLVIINSRVTTSTMPHELGHCINLYHTHHGLGCNDLGGCEEIDGVNNDTCGDFIADTPADPCLLGVVDNNCTYTGGNGYNPDTSNIMSYSTGFCRDNFTEDQGQRMRDALKFEPIFESVISNFCSLAEITSDNIIICEDNLTTFTIENAEPPFNWTVSDNISIEENNGNSIIVSANSSTNGNGLIEVTFDGNSTSKQVWVNEPKFEIFINENGGIPWLEIHYLDVLNTWHYWKQGILETEITYDVDVFDWNEDVPSPPAFYTYGSNGSVEWSVVTGEISVTNDCGTTTIPYVLDMSQISDNGYSKIAKVGNNKYKVLNPITGEYELILLSELYDIYGNIKQEFNTNQEEMNINNQSNSGDLRILKANVNGQILTKTIIVD